jgi:hypothetical protein
VLMICIACRTGSRAETLPDAASLAAASTGFNGNVDKVRCRPSLGTRAATKRPVSGSITRWDGALTPYLPDRIPGTKLSAGSRYSANAFMLPSANLRGRSRSPGASGRG